MTDKPVIDNSGTHRGLPRWATDYHRTITSVTALLLALGALVTAAVALYNALPRGIGLSLPHGKIDLQYLSGRPAYPYDVSPSGKRVVAVADCGKSQVVIGGFCSMNLITVVHSSTLISPDRKTFTCLYHVEKTDAAEGQPRNATATAACIKVDE